MDIDKSISDGLTISIPDQLRTSEFGFIRLGKRSKEPVDKSWQFLARDTRWDDPVIQEWIKSGGNCGVVPLSGDVCILDCDDELLIDAIVEAGATTFSVTTGSGGKHYYFRCSGLGDKKIVIYDENDNHLGEVYPSGCKAYCVGPGCIHPNGNSYVPDDYDMVRFDNFKTDIISKFKSNFDKKLEECIPKSAHFLTNKLTEQLGLRIEEIGYPVGKVTKNGDEIQGSHPIHGSTTGKNYSINTRKNLFYCFPRETLVNTEDGLKRIDEIIIGDRVYDIDGKLTDVNYVFNRNYSGNAYTVHSALTPVTATEGHEIYIARCNKCTKSYEGYSACKPNCKRRKKDGKHNCPRYIDYVEMWIPIECINPETDFLVVPKNQHIPVSFSIGVYTDGARYQKRMLPSHVTVDGDLAFLMGWYIADGNISAKGNSLLITLGSNNHKNKYADELCNIVNDKFGF